MPVDMSFFDWVDVVPVLDDLKEYLETSITATEAFISIDPDEVFDFDNGDNTFKVGIIVEASGVFPTGISAKGNLAYGTRQIRLKILSPSIGSPWREYKARITNVVKKLVYAFAYRPDIAYNFVSLTYDDYEFDDKMQMSGATLVFDQRINN
jgi:hypothetical protein